MYDSHVGCPHKFVRMVDRVVDGEMNADYASDQIQEAYDEGEISSSSYDHLMGLLVDYL